MKQLKPHFWYTKSQRNGVFLLIALIVVFQAIYVFVDLDSADKVNLEKPEIIAFQQQIDSLKRIKIAESEPKIYPFNPNYITDFKGQQLGLSPLEIDRLFAFRKTNKFINSAKEFQQITKVSDSVLSKIAPLFKFPNWVTKNAENKTAKENSHKITFSTTDLNGATEQDLKKIKGIGETLSKRILNYKKRIQGFTYTSQLYEVWNLDSLVVSKILSKFSIQQLPTIKKININTATFKQVLSNPYIDYELCKKIFAYKDEIAEYQTLDQLKNIADFPLGKFDRIILYLVAQ